MGPTFFFFFGTHPKLMETLGWMKIMVVVVAVTGEDEKEEEMLKIRERRKYEEQPKE